MRPLGGSSRVGSSWSNRLVVTGLAGWLGFSGAAGCGRTLEADPERRAVELAYIAERKLAAGRLRESRQAYEDLLALRPEDAEASFGAAVTSLLLLPDTQPVAELAKACREPLYDVENQVFGADGVLAELAERRKGTGELRLYTRRSPSAAFEEQALNVRALYTVREGSELKVEVDADDAGGEQVILQLRINAGDLYPGDTIEPLEHGTLIDLAKAKLPLRIWSRPNISASPSTGQVRFQGGTHVGEVATFELLDVTVVGATATSLEHFDYFEYRLAGRISDTVSSHNSPQVDALAFVGPAAPTRSRERATNDDVSEMTAWLRQCVETFSTDQLAFQGAELARELEPILAHLNQGLAGGAEGASFVVPASLLHSDVDLQLNGTDLLLLRSVLHAASGVLRLAAVYRYLDGPLSALVSEGPRCGPTPFGLRIDQERLLANLTRTFLTRVSGGDLIPAVREDLRMALRDAAASLRTRPTLPGTFNFQAPSTANHSEYLAQVLDAARASIDSEEPVEIPSNPHYRIHLRRFFDAPFDREGIIARNGRGTLFERSTEPACDPDVELLLPRDLRELGTWTGGVLLVDADPAGASCSKVLECPATYVCEGASEAAPGQCKVPAFRSLDDPSWRFDFVRAHEMVSPSLQRFLRGLED